MALNDTPANLRFRVGVVKINQRDGDARITLGVAAFDRVVVCRDKKTNRRSFMLGWLDKPITTKSKGAAREMVNLPAFCRDSVLPEIPTKATAEYEPTGLLIAVQSADRRFQELWKARLGFIPLANVQRKHWATIKALVHPGKERRLMCSVGGKPTEVKVRNLVAWIEGERETESLVY